MDSIEVFPWPSFSSRSLGGDVTGPGIFYKGVGFRSCRVLGLGFFYKGLGPGFGV